MTFAYDLFRTVLGMSVMLGTCYLFSANRRAIDWKLVGIGVAMQFALALLILKVDGVSTVFDYVAAGFRKTLEFTAAGAEFLFGSIVVDLDSFGYIFAFQVLPTIVFFSALSAILYYLGILQKVVYGLAWLLSKAMGLSGPESLAAAANVFIGQTEAPLVVKPYLESMTRSELLCVMVGGMATIAGSVFVSYIGFLGGTDPESQQFFARHLLTASIISAPAAIVCAKMLLPETPAAIAAVTGGVSTDPHEAKVPERDERLEMAADESNNLLDAISRGTTDGLRLAVNVGAMLLVFTALIYMLNVLFVGGTEVVNDLATWTGLTDANWNEAIAIQTGGTLRRLQLYLPVGPGFRSRRLDNWRARRGHHHRGPVARAENRDQRVCGVRYFPDRASRRAGHESQERAHCRLRPVRIRQFRQYRYPGWWHQCDCSRPAQEPHGTGAHRPGGRYRCLSDDGGGGGFVLLSCRSMAYRRISTVNYLVNDGIHRIEG
ncbi:CNT family concentrative nucleoside transporter [Neolewinella xylanilytica]|uniref:CNT family concentrative nucleoside transporter n=1 Tax=Neolewinella xylanilytica TaxID=1514080 RepID=A0A2S6I000_9BACT|nr:CNT family concentrative nucleoside transporter [Neolewinella xylanilytica]